MTEAVAPPLADWESFYVIIGSSAAALTGLMFVVIALIADAGPRSSATSQGIATFATPSIVHFCVALLISATLSAPWHRLSGVCAALAICGAGGLVYTAIVLRRALHVTGYQPVMEDWLAHAVFPFIAYAAIVVAAVWLRGDPVSALFIVGGATLLLVFIGIHNAWDTVTHITLQRLAREKERT